MGHILVTGATGFIASHVVRQLLELKKKEGWDHEIVCLVRRTSNLKNLEGLDVKLVIGDFRIPGSLIPAVKGASYIYHVGAELYVTTRRAFLDANTTGVENLLKATVEHAGPDFKRFLFVSSLAAAGPASGLDKPRLESDEPATPVSWYAESKLEAEKILHSYKGKIPYTIVRATAVYGPRDPAFAAIFKAVRMRIHPVSGFKTRYVGMVYAPDLAEGIIMAARSHRALYETYFLTRHKNGVPGDGTTPPQQWNYSIKEMVKTLAQGVGKPWGILFPAPLLLMQFIAYFVELIALFTRQDPSPTRDKVRDITPVFWHCSAQKAKDHLGWVAKHSLLDGAKITHESMLAEEKDSKEMPLLNKGTLFLKYVIIGMVIGTLIEILAEFGKVYSFTPWYFMFGVIIGMWGLLFGAIAMWTRKLPVVVQYLPGFIFLFVMELLNHYMMHRWTFHAGNFIGLAEMTPWIRAMWLGIATGFIIPLYNNIQAMFYQIKLDKG